MSLATRCTACGTAFRVVQDQLKVSEGWVRCGRCSEVFNALEGLFDLERDGWPEGAERERAPQSGAPAAARAGAGEDSVPRVQRGAEPQEGRAQAGAGLASAGADHTAVEAEPDLLETVSDGPVVPRAATEPPPSGAPTYVLERAAADGADDLPLAHRYPEDEAEEPPLEAPLADLGAVPTTGMDLPPFVSSGPGLLQDAPSPSAPALRDSETAVEERVGRTSSFGERIDAHLFGKRRSARRHAPVSHVSARDQLDFSDARFDSDLLADDALEGPAPDAVEAPPSETALPEAPAAPEFLRRAEREARWRRPAVRGALGAAGVGLTAMLALQAGHHFRDDAAVRWPALKPVLAGWCELAGCTLEAPRHIDDISVESTALTRAPGDAFRLAVTLRSRGNVPLTLPWIDLTLTDAGGRLIARRALPARDLRPSAPLLQPGQEVGLQALVSARNARVTGYTVEIFYP